MLDDIKFLPMSALRELTQPHIESFNALFNNGVIDSIVANLEGVEISDGKSCLKVCVEEVSVFKPFLPEKEYISVDRRLLPRECRDMLSTYRGKLVVRYGFSLNGEHFCSEDRSGGHMPIMLRSVLCHLSTMGENEHLRAREDKNEIGGYFIVNGQEKVVRFMIIQKRNHIFAQNKVSYLKKGKNLTEHSVVMRCVGRDEVASMMFVHYALDGNVYVRVFYRRSEYLMPAVLILKCLTGATDKEIFECLYYKEDSLLKCKLEMLLRKNGDAGMTLLGSKFKDVFKSQTYTEVEAGELFLKKLIAVHLDEKQDKYNFLVGAIKKLFRLVEGEVLPDDQDNPMNHEILGTAQLFAFILKEKLEESLRMAKMFYAKKGFKLTKHSILENFVRKFDTQIGHKVETFLATGNYDTSKCTDVLQSTGFTILAERVNFYRFLSHFRCVNRGTFFATVKISSVRKLRPESWGFLCPVHTPDGTPCGLLNHLAHRASIFSGKENLDVSVLIALGMSVLDAQGHEKDTVVVMVDGKVVGRICSRLAGHFAQQVREYRSRNAMRIEIVCVPCTAGLEPGVFIFTTIGRFTRPLLNTSQGLEEHIGIMEQVFLDIALKRANESNGDASVCYVEANTTNFLSVVAGLTPFSEYNQSPRNMYQCQMAKQSMGIPFLNTKHRSTSKSYHLVYTQDPVVRTHFYDLYGLATYPIGINAIVAVLSYTAYDMEDAMVINSSSIDRGFFDATIYKSEVIELEKDCYVMETPSVGDVINTNDTIVKYRNRGNEVLNIRYGGMETGCVDSVQVFCNQTISQLINTAVIKLRIGRPPTIGDKFCSRHGQKGVCSQKWPLVDMPFSESGLVPDIIINPNAFPSRMTIGMLMESLAGKAGCILGKVQMGTPFMDSRDTTDGQCVDRREAFCDELQQSGFNYYGNEPMYSGITGKEFRTDIYIGVVYYQRLRHMVSDKFQVRNTGPVQPQTRQPVQGRSKHGGVRLGEMERDALIGHGTAYILQDRLINCSDGSDFFYCKRCRSILFATKDACKCGSLKINDIRLPYVFKYLVYELLAMNIRVRVNCE